MTARYRLTHRLASGEVSEVFAGIAQGDEGFEKPVAVKRLQPHLLQDARMQERFLAEAKRARHLHHQNLVSVLDVGRGADGLFLVMEWVDGWDLRTLRLRAREGGKTFPPHLAAWLVSQVNAGLRHAYGKQVEGRPVFAAHPALADANVLVSTEGEVKVTGFGSPRAPGLVGDSLSYAAPELHSGEPASWASDGFSLGVLLFELLTGSHPRRERVHAAPPDLSRVPASLQDLVQQMLSPSPADRPSPEDLSARLGGWLASTGSAAGADELAAFVRSLSPPPTPLELPADPSLQETSAASGTWLELQAAEPWQPPPGPALDESGRLDRFGALGGPPTPTPPQTSTQAPVPLPVSPSPPEAHPALPPRSFTQDDGPLELARDLRREAPPEAMQPVYPPMPRQRGGGAGVIVAIIVVALVAAAAWYLWPTVHRRIAAQLPGLIPAPRIHVLSIDSEPSGATVRVDGRELGQTPLLMENDYPPRDIPVELHLRGHKPWRGTFGGGKEVKLQVPLEPLRGR